MNAAVSLDVLLRRQGAEPDSGQVPLPLATPGVQRWVWESRYGPMLIEVIQGQIYLNGELVQAHTG
jgi:hypothetical protein